MSSFSNSGEEESQKNIKNLEYTDDANIVQQAFQMDEEMQEESCMSHTDNGKKVPSDLDGDQFTNGEQIKGEERKIKESKNKKVLKRKKSKRNYEEYSNTDVKNYKDTVEEFTRYRSIKFARENEDKVESRSLAQKVSLF
jgi:hypothetical protein